MKIFNPKVLCSATLALWPMISVMTCGANDTLVTYHNDPQRTGWNANETTLTPGTVASGFGLITQVALDDQVDTQPLVVPNQSIANQGTHNVVYVATENNSIYAIDASSGTILLHKNLGAPVTAPLKCNVNGPNVGINGTPTIDVTTQTLYVIAYVTINNTPTYQLHALNLGTLADKPGSPLTIRASNTLTDGSVFNFNASYQRQRAALLQANGNIYAGFASFCDLSVDKSRGWVLGWNAMTLSPVMLPLVANELTNKITTSTQFYLSSVWMSGYGLSTDSTSGDIFFTTGNSDFKAPTYTGTTNIQDSVVRMHGSLTGVTDLFTPSNYFALDQSDLDFSSGGVMVLPDQPGPIKHLAVAAGKDGRMFILNRDNLGGFQAVDVPPYVYIYGPCWCGPSYFVGADGIGRVVSSGGIHLVSWKINTSTSQILQAEASASISYGKQDGGFFTSVSSNGTAPNSAIIWAVGRPDSSGNIKLYAFNGTASGQSLTQLWSGVAGIWIFMNGNANIVPTVANGHVYVASYKTLAIFGLTSKPANFIAATGIQHSAALAKSSPKPTPGTEYSGTIVGIKGSQIALKLPSGQVLPVDLSQALAKGTTVVPVQGIHVSVTGTINTQGLFGADMMLGLKVLPTQP